MTALGNIVTRYHLQNVLFFFIALFLAGAQTSCIAIAPSAVDPCASCWPTIAKGWVMDLYTGGTYYWLSEVMLKGGDIWASPNLTHFLVRWAIPDSKGLNGFAVINTLETTPAYWQNLRGGIANGEDAKSMADYVAKLGWIKVSVKDLGVTSLASKIALYGASTGEVLFGAAGIWLEDWFAIVSQQEDL